MNELPNFLRRDQRHDRRLGRTLIAMTLAIPLLSGCASWSVPDAVNPVEWYRSTADTVGGWFNDEDEDRRRSDGDRAAGSGSSAFPKLSSVPSKPGTKTNADQRRKLISGLVADRENAKYAEQKASSGARSDGVKSVLSSPVEKKKAKAVAKILTENKPAAVRALPSQRVRSGQSSLWPNGPVPNSAGDRPTTMARVGEVKSAESTMETKMPAVPTSRSLTTATAAPVAPSTREEESVPQVAAVEAPKPAEPAPQPAMSDDGVIKLIPPSETPTAADQSSISLMPPSDDQPTAGTGGFDLSQFLVPLAGEPGSGITVLKFGHGSARLSRADRREIARLAQILKQSEATVTIVGHASERTADMDPVKHDMVNFLISMERANAVAQAFMKQGIDSSRIFVEAVGATMPLVPEIMPRFEAENRRAEIIINS